MAENLLRRIWAEISQPRGILVQPGGLARKILGECADALVLAEADEQALAGSIVRRGGTGRRRILVLGHGPSFSPRLAEYAVGLAQRLEYGLVFLNVCESDGHGATPQMGAYLREGFARRSGDEARPWLLLAASQGIDAGHVVRFGETAAEVEGLCSDLHRVELILSDPGEGARLEGRTPSTLFTVR